MPADYPTFTGALIDERSADEKLSDVKLGELVATANTVKWEEKPEAKWRTFPVLDQRQSFMCGAFSMKKMLGIYYWLKYGVWVDFSEEHIYQRRYNKPAAGMAVDDLYRILQEGTTLKVLTQADITTDADADGTKIGTVESDVGKIFKTGVKVTVPVDIELIASVIQTTGKPVHLMTFFTHEEYSSFVPKVLGSLNPYAATTSRHFVAAVDFTLYNGKPHLVIEDSAHFGGLSRRLFSAEWVSQRLIVATYPMNFAFDGTPVTPPTVATFSKPLEFIPWSDLTNAPLDEAKHASQKYDVVKLQNVLKGLGFFPKNVSSTGYYGSTTAAAVYKFQVAYKVASLSELDSFVPKGSYVGVKTRAALNRL